MTGNPKTLNLAERFQLFFVGDSLQLTTCDGVTKEPCSCLLACLLARSLARSISLSLSASKGTLLCTWLPLLLAITFSVKNAGLGVHWHHCDAQTFFYHDRSTVHSEEASDSLASFQAVLQLARTS